MNFSDNILKYFSFLQCCIFAKTLLIDRTKDGAWTAFSKFPCSFSLSQLFKKPNPFFLDILKDLAPSMKKRGRTFFPSELHKAVS